MGLKLVNYNQAKALKELGFNYKCSTFYYPSFTIKKVRRDKFINWNDYVSLVPVISAPPLELVKLWLMSKFIFINIIYSNKRFHLEILNDKSMILYKNYNFDLYEEALLVGIDKAIEILN